jgi:hypothetical protein
MRQTGALHSPGVSASSAGMGGRRRHLALDQFDSYGAQALRRLQYIELQEVAIRGARRLLFEAGQVKERTVQRYFRRGLQRQFPSWHSASSPPLLGIDEHFFTRSSGITEELHNKMELVNRQAYGFRNFQNYRLRARIMCS